LRHSLRRREESAEALLGIPNRPETGRHNFVLRASFAGLRLSPNMG
jgi:hypothetical protein